MHTAGQLRSTREWRALAVLAFVLTALLGGCAETPLKKKVEVAVAPAPEPPEPAEEEPAAAPEPAEPAPVRPPTPQERAEAQKVALRAVDLLDAGEEPAARRELDRAISLDAENKLAVSLMRQITEDPIAVHGSQSFTYRVQPNESLSAIAKKFLGDIYLFYGLARYNDIKVPRQLHAGQVIKVPGRGPPAAATAPDPAPRGRGTDRAQPTPRGKEPSVAVAKPPPSSPAPEPAEPVSQGARAYQQGLQLLKSGNRDAAYGAFTQAVRADPQHAEARAHADQLRQELVQNYHRLATTAFHRQDMATAIKHWTRVLELDPNHAAAKVQRERAIELAKRIGQY